MEKIKQEQPVEKVVKKPVEVKKEIKKEYKDKVYELNLNETPIVFVLKSRGLFWFDEKVGYEREMKYCENQKTIFVDEMKGPERLSHIIFRDGQLYVPKEKQTLQKFLDLHPWNGTKFKEYNPVKIAEEMKRHGGYIPGIRPGKKTAEYVNLVLSRLTFGGATYLAAVCLFPYILFDLFDIPFYFGGTALLIVVGVGLDLVNQIEAFLLNQNYDGFMKKTKRRQLRTGALKL